MLLFLTHVGCDHIAKKVYSFGGKFFNECFAFKILTLCSHEIWIFSENSLAVALSLKRHHLSIVTKKAQTFWTNLAPCARICVEMLWCCKTFKTNYNSSVILTLFPWLKRKNNFYSWVAKHQNSEWAGAANERFKIVYFFAGLRNASSSNWTFCFPWKFFK